MVHYQNRSGGSGVNHNHDWESYEREVFKQNLSPTGRLTVQVTGARPGQQYGGFSGGDKGEDLRGSPVPAPILHASLPVSTV